MQLDHNTVYLLLGSNLGNREEVINKAIDLINDKIGKVVCKSSMYETEPWGKTDQPGFLNLALQVQTDANAITVLHTALEIEKQLGRVRLERWGSRIIDIDIIFFNQEVIHIKEELTIPHPEMQNRKFVLEPLSEIAADFKHPVLNQTIRELYETLTDNAVVKKF
jgi:2-amino-4-hydroxy-6-hydroxymethyldihydropteridine diphosphokinase